MASAAWDIESIVGEVLRRLRREAADAPGDKRSKSAQTGNSPATAATPTAESRPAPWPANKAPGELLVADRVVSLAVLDGRLANVRRLVTRPGAVITPSARDELRARRIELVRAAAELPAVAVSNGPLLAVVAADGESNGPADALADEVQQVERFPADGLLAAVQFLAERITSRGEPGVLLTDEPIAAVCLANRIHGVRAAWADDRRTVQRAVAGIGANLLVLTPQRGGPTNARALIKEFAAAGRPTCPDAFLSMLERVR